MIRSGPCRTGSVAGRPVSDSVRATASAASASSQSAVFRHTPTVTGRWNVPQASAMPSLSLIRFESGGIRSHGRRGQTSIPALWHSTRCVGTVPRISARLALLPG